MGSGREELCDLLFDLQHDLGKYLRQPLAYLPAEASPEAVLAAVRTALFATRRGPQGVRAARQIWTDFTTSAGAALSDFAGYARLEQVVNRALAWEAAANAGAPLDREAASADFGAVEPAIRQLLEELHGRN